MNNLLFPFLLVFLTLVAASSAMAQRVIKWGAPFDRAPNNEILNVSGVAAAYNSYYSLRSNGTVLGWGSFDDSGTAYNVPPAGLNGVVAVATGERHSLALKNDGSVVAWGSSPFGETAVPTDLNDAVAVAANSSGSLALRANGTLVAWGFNVDHASISELTGVVSIVGGDNFYLTLQSNGSVTLLGKIRDSQAVPLEVQSGVAAIAAGGDHALALKKDGTVIAWGRNNFGQATPPAGLTDVVDIAAGSGQSLALRRNGTVVAWGYNETGESSPPSSLNGVGAVFAGNASLALVGIPGAVPAIVSGKVLRASPALLGLSGEEVHYQIRATGDPTSYSATGLPAGLVLDATTGLITGVPQEQGVFTITLGATNSAGAGSGSLKLIVDGTLALSQNLPSRLTLSSRAAIRWAVHGVNWSAQNLPPGMAIDASTGVVSGSPERPGFYSATLTGSNNATTITIPWDVEVSPLAAWGNNDFGQTAIPASLANIVAVSAGHNFNLALRSDGTLAAWGDNTHGQTNIPPGLNSVVAIEACESHCLAIKQDGSVVAWGNNDHGQCSVPADLGPVIAVAGGTFHSLALRADGTVAAWPMDNFTAPPGLLDVIAIAADGAHSLALKADGSVTRWLNGDSATRTPNITSGEPPFIAITTHQGVHYYLRHDGIVMQNLFGEEHLIAANMATISAGADRLAGLKTTAGIEDGLLPPHGISFVDMLDAGSQHTLVLISNPAEAPRFLGVPFARYKVTSQPGANFYHRIQATGSPTSFSAAGLPAGLTLNAATGVISGVTTASGNFPVTIQASNASGSASRVVMISAHGQPQFVVHVPKTILLGRPLSIAITTDDNSNVTAQNLPHGVVFNPTTRRVEGSPNVPGPFSATFVASNVHGSAILAWNGEVSSVIGWSESSDGRPLPGSTDVTAIASGQRFSIGLKSDGTVAAWDEALNLIPNPPTAFSQLVAVAAGRNHALGLRGDGTVAVWPGVQPEAYANSYLQKLYTAPAGLTNVVAIAAGNRHSLALKSGGNVVAWGENDEGECSVPAGLGDIVAISAGENFSLALRSNGTVVGWGAEDEEFNYGQSVAPAGLTDVVAIAASSYRSLALKSDGTVVAWGQNRDNQATPPSELMDVVAIAAGPVQSFAIRRNGTIAAWGSGDSDALQVTIPADVPPAVGISVGFSHATLLVGQAGIPHIAGAPFLRATPAMAGQPGESVYYRISASGSPVSYAATGLPSGLVLNPATGEITGIPAGSGTFIITLEATNAHGTGSRTVKALIDGGPAITFEPPPTIPLRQPLAFSCSALRATSWSAVGLPPGIAINSATGEITGEPMQIGAYSVQITASNSLGTATRQWDFEVTPIIQWGLAPEYEATPPRGIGKTVALAGTSNSTLALRKDGTIAAWGQGQTTVNIPLPQHSGVAAIACGIQHTLALNTDGAVLQWQHIDPTRLEPPAAASTDVVAVAAGNYHSLALKRDGTVVEWGADTDVPLGLSNVVAVAASNCSMALKSDGTVVIWGHSEGPRNPPSGLSNVVAIAAGGSHFVALKNDGTAVSWNNDTEGANSLPSPLSGVVAIAAGGSHALALKSDGTVVAWGYNDFGATSVPTGLSGVVSIAASLYRSTALIGERQQTSASTAKASVGVPFTHQVAFAFDQPTPVGLNIPITYQANGLPPGLSIHTNTGVISGSPAAAGNFSIQLSVSGVSKPGVLQLLVDDPAASQAAYTAWSELHFTAGSDLASPSDDHDGDGIVNLLEFAQGTDPKSASPANTSVRQLPDGRLEISIHSPESLANLVFFSAEFGSDLALEPGSIVEQEPLAPAIEGMLRYRFIAPVGLPSAERQFGRIKVSLP